VDITSFENQTFWLEVVANTAFGISWFVKGGGFTILRDDWSPIKEPKQLTKDLLGLLLFVVVMYVVIAIPKT
ncbi:MAG: hypothetical protein ACXAC2_17375, partial [Candidatus Kariarchaeaceae archaeon]